MTYTAILRTPANPDMDVEYYEADSIDAAKTAAVCNRAANISNTIEVVRNADGRTVYGPHLMRAQSAQK